MAEVLVSDLSKVSQPWSGELTLGPEPPDAKCCVLAFLGEEVES